MNKNVWKPLPPFEASPGEIVKLYECPHCQGTGYVDDIKKLGFSYKE
jgi:hypothetical protein